MSCGLSWCGIIGIGYLSAVGLSCCRSQRAGRSYCTDLAVWAGGRPGPGPTCMTTLGDDTSNKDQITATSRPSRGGGSGAR